MDKPNKFEAVKEVLDQTSEGLLNTLSGVDGALDELFDTGSLTIYVEGKEYVVSLHVEEVK